VKLIGWLAGLMLLFGATETVAQPSEPWQAWQYSRRIISQTGTESSLVRVVLPMEIYAHAQVDLDDLRLIDDVGGEVPFVLHAMQGRQAREWRKAPLTDVGFVPGRYTHVIVDAGKRQEQHNLLELHFDEADFFSWVEIAASDDRTTWRLIRDRAPLYRFRDDGVERVPNLSYPQTHARWLRVRILDKDKKLLPRQGRVAYEVVEPAERTQAPVIFTKVEPLPLRGSQWQADLGDAQIPLSAVRFEATQSEFHRAVRISTSVDGTHWTTRCHGDIYRYRSAGEATGEIRDRTSLEITCPEAQARFWRVTVLDRNDVPIVGLRPIPEQVTRSVVFRQDPSHSYRVLYGHNRAQAAQYELGRLLSSGDLKTAVNSQLGPEELNRNHVSAEPWTERHPILLWTALLIVVAVLGVQAVRAIR
jgi:Protein of unknown function (DUF3999)